MSELFIFISMFASLSGIVLILRKRCPELKKLRSSNKQLLSDFLPGIKEKLKKAFEHTFGSVSWQIVFQKIISKIKIFALKTERKSDVLLGKIRKKTQEQQDNKEYWQKLSQSSPKVKKKKKKKPS